MLLTDSNLTFIASIQSKTHSSVLIQSTCTAYITIHYHLPFLVRKECHSARGLNSFSVNIKLLDAMKSRANHVTRKLNNKATAWSMFSLINKMSIEDIIQRKRKIYVVHVSIPRGCFIDCITDLSGLAQLSFLVQGFMIIFYISHIIIIRSPFEFER